MEEPFRMKQFNKAVLLGEVTWWQMELPSGRVIFGDAKAKMPGYPDSDFNYYQDFTKLIHPDDYNNAMNAMYDHIAGKKKFYETQYRIKNISGEYISFYDCGQIIKKEGNEITVIGFVMKVKGDVDFSVQMESFKDLILGGNPSIVELVAKLKN